jgi:hypothetical protein
MASKSAMALERYKKKAARAYEEKQATVRAVVSGIEILGGAAASGYLAAAKPEIAGIPTDAGTGIAMLAGGMALESPDMIATGLGFLSGYARSQGEQLALSGNLPFTGSPDPTVFVVNE